MARADAPGRAWSRRGGRCGVTPARPERLDILAQQRARLRAVIDEQRESRAARQRLDAERAGAGKQIEHARAGDRIAVGVHQDVEQRLAQPVGGRADAPPTSARRAGARAIVPPTMRISVSAAPALAMTWAAALAACGRGAVAAVAFLSFAATRAAAAPASLGAAVDRRLVRFRVRDVAVALAREMTRAGELGRASCIDQIGAAKSAPASADDLLAELVAQCLRLDLLDLAFGEVAELERAERHADQPVHLQPEMSPARCAPRGSCLRGCAKVSQTLAPCSRSSVASIGP